MNSGSGTQPEPDLLASWYFAYGSNMNPARMAARKIVTRAALPGRLDGFRLAFDKRGRIEGEGHANVVYQPRAQVEGVLYQLQALEELAKLDRFERTPINYSRELVRIEAGTGAISAWVYIANPGARSGGLLPSAEYLSHLLAGARFLSPSYLEALRAHPVLAPTAA
ncbi:MAG: gamma-glutamylcyclotransferase family protein [Pseudomonadota bacterium]